MPLSARRERRPAEGARDDRRTDAPPPVFLTWFQVERWLVAGEIGPPELANHPLRFGRREYAVSEPTRSASRKVRRENKRLREQDELFERRTAELWRALQMGKLVGYGRPSRKPTGPGVGPREALSALDWSAAEFPPWGIEYRFASGGGLLTDFNTGGRRWTDLKFKSEDVFGLWPPASSGETAEDVVPTSGVASCETQVQENDRLAVEEAMPQASGEQRCLLWLEQKMRAGPPKKPKPLYRDEAANLFVVSIRGFDRLWARAIESTGKTVWSRAGRKS